MNLFRRKDPETIIKVEPTALSPVFDLTKRQAQRSTFCFAGEFGFEVVSWIPYLLFLKKKLGLKLSTLARPGSRIFYYFSDHHEELIPSDITGIWGAKTSYEAIGHRFPDLNLIHPSGSEQTCQTEISVAGFSWTNKNIHQKISSSNYLRPNYSFVKKPLPFTTTRRIVVINNKFAREWDGPPVNYFDRSALVKLCDYLMSKGYFVVYNRFIEKTAIDQNRPLRDNDLFVGKYTYDMRRYYEMETGIGKRNETQLSLFNQARLVIGVQGGNVYLPAVCQKPIYMLMRVGDYIDYQELSRVFKCQINCFYEPNHLLSFLSTNLG